MDKQIHSTGAPGFLPAQSGNVPITMSSREIAELVNSRHDDVKRSIDRLVERGVIVQPPLADEPGFDSLGRPRITQVYRIGKRDSYVIVAQLSPEFTARLVDRWQELEAGQMPRLPTTAEAFANVFAMVADQERRQIAQQHELKAIEAKVDQVAQAHVILDTLPSDCEYITVIRKRMNKQYGLSETIVDTVMRNSPYAPTTRALVKNKHVEAAGAHNQGFSKKEVSAVFRRFVGECQMVTATMATHPFIEGTRFKLTGKAGA